MEPKLPDRTQRVIELSDEIAAINLRILERVKAGIPADPADGERLNRLMLELNSTRESSE